MCLSIGGIADLGKHITSDIYLHSPRDQLYVVGMSPALSDPMSSPVQYRSQNLLGRVSVMAVDNKYKREHDRCSNYRSWGCRNG